MMPLFSEEWHLEQAPPANDIVWDNFTNANRWLKTFIRGSSWIILLLVSIILLTPLKMLDELDIILKTLAEFIESFEYQRSDYEYLILPL